MLHFKLDIKTAALAILGGGAPVVPRDGLSFSQVGELVPQAHGGALMRGGTPETSAKGGRAAAERRRARAERVIEQLLDRHANDEVVLIFSHGGILQHLLSALMGTRRTWGVSVRNTAVFEFTLDLERWASDGDDLHSPTWWRIERFNDASHLAD